MARFEFKWPISEQQVVRQVITVNSLGLKDLREVWDKFIPNMRQRMGTRFTQQVSPFGESWAPLSPNYAKWKAEHFPGKLILERSGALRRAVSDKGTPGQFIEMRPRGFTFTVMRMSGSFNVGRIHQVGGNRMPRRSWLGLTNIDYMYLQAQIKAYFLRLKGKATAIGGGRA